MEQPRSQPPNESLSFSTVIDFQPEFTKGAIYVKGELTADQKLEFGVILHALVGALRLAVHNQSGLDQAGLTGTRPLELIDRHLQQATGALSVNMDVDGTI